MNIYPKITIVTPSLNQGKYIEKTILSVLNQNYPNLEYIIIDGGSTDNSVEIIKKYEAKLTYWITEKDSGQSEAINKGFKIATGEIINWLNSDDYLEKDTLFKVAHYFKSNDIYLLIGQSYNFNKTCKYLAGPKGTDIFERVLVGMACPQPSTFMRKTAIDNLGLLEQDLHFTMDWELYARIALNYPLLYVEDVFSWQLLHHEGKMIKDKHKFAEEGKLVYSKIVDSLHFSSHIVEHLKYLGYYTQQNKYKNYSKKITKKQIDSSFILFLHKLSHHEYNILNTTQAIRNINLLKQLDRVFYAKNKLGALKIKCLLPTWLLRRLKKLK
jgi:glycosyltransferase involved in cell wall biosynthesis